MITRTNPPSVVVTQVRVGDLHPGDVFRYERVRSTSPWAEVVGVEDKGSCVVVRHRFPSGMEMEYTANPFTLVEYQRVAP